MAKELNEETSFNISIKTLAGIAALIFTIVGMWFALQADIEEAKQLPEPPAPVITRMEFDMKPTSIMIIISLFLCITVLANVWGKEEVVVIIKKNDVKEEQMWIPTKEDIAYQDSMYTIISNTQNDITDIKKDIVYILERLDYKDGTWDSIRYVKGGKIDKRRNK